jgi:hypothetical protein
MSCGLGVKEAIEKRWIDAQDHSMWTDARDHSILKPNLMRLLTKDGTNLFWAGEFEAINEMIRPGSSLPYNNWFISGRENPDDPDSAFTWQPYDMMKVMSKLTEIDQALAYESRNMMDGLDDHEYRITQLEADSRVSMQQGDGQKPAGDVTHEYLYKVLEQKLEIFKRSKDILSSTISRLKMQLSETEQELRDALSDVTNLKLRLSYKKKERSRQERIQFYSGFRGVWHGRPIARMKNHELIDALNWIRIRYPEPAQYPGVYSQIVGELYARDRFYNPEGREGGQ